MKLTKSSTIPVMKKIPIPVVKGFKRDVMRPQQASWRT
jgi:hypothetical protein